jgi:hypothetical protein
MSAPTVVRDLVVAHTRMLKLPGVARTIESLARQARDSHWSHEDYLHEVLRAEEASRHESVIRQRLREARFPEVKTLDTFDFAAADGVNATQIHTLARANGSAKTRRDLFTMISLTSASWMRCAIGRRNGRMTSKLISEDSLRGVVEVARLHVEVLGLQIAVGWWLWIEAVIQQHHRLRVL